MSTIISVIICTYNRAEILPFCLSSIITADDNNDLELIVVDNNSNDHTKEVVSKYPRFKYVYEEKQGLSYARNRGVSEAIGEWVFFIDDDCRVKKDIFTQALLGINIGAYKLISGVFKAWYRETPPKWLPHNVGNYPNSPHDTLSPLGEYYVSGGVMLIHKNTLEQTALFPIDRGMKGNSIGYGEETYVEYRFRENNIPIGMNPDMIIYHQVLPYKYKIGWIMKSFYQYGLVAYGTNNNIINSLFIILKQLIKIVYYTIVPQKHQSHRRVVCLQRIAYFTGIIRHKLSGHSQK